MLCKTKNFSFPVDIFMIYFQILKFEIRKQIALNLEYLICLTKYLSMETTSSCLNMRPVLDIPAATGQSGSHDFTG